MPLTSTNKDLDTETPGVLRGAYDVSFVPSLFSVQQVNRQCLHDFKMHLD